MRNRLQLAFGVALVLLTASVPLLAHHGAAQFDVGKKVTVKGTVVEWFWANPIASYGSTLRAMTVKWCDGLWRRKAGQISCLKGSPSRPSKLEMR